MEPRLCAKCGRAIRRDRNSNYCGEPCRVAAKQARYRQRTPKTRQDLLHLRNLVAHGMIAQKLIVDPKLAQEAIDTCKRWVAQRGDAPALSEWREILRGIEPLIESGDRQALRTEVTRLCEILLDPSEEGMRRRSSSPFTNILNAQERSIAFETMRL